MKWKYHDTDLYRSDNIFHCSTVKSNILENDSVVGSCTNRTFELIDGSLYYTYYYGDEIHDVVEYVRTNEKVRSSCDQ